MVLDRIKKVNDIKQLNEEELEELQDCLLYTSDAADE